MNNSVKTLIVRSFNEGHQGLLERNVPSGWGGLGESGGGGGVGGGWGISKIGNLFWHRKITCEEALQILLKSFSPFEGGLKDCNEEECRGTEKSCMLYFVL